MKTKEQLTNINVTLGDLFKGYISLTLHATQMAIQPTTAITATAPLIPTPVSITSFYSALTSPLLSSTTLPLVDVLLSLQLDLPSSPSAINDNYIPPQYLLSRMISTVLQLWREWTVDLKGGLSIQGLEDLYGPCWHPMHKESVLYGWQKVI